MLKAEIAPDVLKLLINNAPLGAYVTGSFVIGGATSISDIDIVMPIDKCIDDRQLIRITAPTGRRLEYSCYNNGRKLYIPGCTTINILTLHPLDYAAFRFATDTMRRNPVIADRNTRHRCFEELCHAYKSFINPECVSIVEMYKVISRYEDDEYMVNRIDWENFYARQSPEV